MRLLRGVEPWQLEFVALQGRDVAAEQVQALAARHVEVDDVVQRDLLGDDRAPSGGIMCHGTGYRVPMSLRIPIMTGHGRRCVRVAATSCSGCTSHRSVTTTVKSTACAQSAPWVSRCVIAEKGAIPLAAGRPPLRIAPVSSASACGLARQSVIP